MGCAPSLAPAPLPPRRADRAAVDPRHRDAYVEDAVKAGAVHQECLEGALRVSVYGFIMTPSTRPV